jgi:hypothetical protein
MVTSGSKSDSRNAEDSSALPHLEKSFLSETVRGFEPEGKNLNSLFAHNFTLVLNGLSENRSLLVEIIFFEHTILILLQD